MPSAREVAAAFIADCGETLDIAPLTDEQAEIIERIALDHLTAYAETVAAQEREACARIVETLEMRPPLSRSERVVRDGYVRAIRQRATPPPGGEEKA